MHESFDVIELPWIPVRTKTGETENLGIRDVLSRAHELDSISHPSPMIEYGLHRLLITFLMDAFRPEDTADIENLREEEQFDMNSLDKYIQLCRDEGVTFDLFSLERPFLQTPFRDEWDSKLLKPVTAMDNTLPTGNNHTHFVHKDALKPLNYDEAARLLPAVQLFCTAAVQGYPSGVNGAPPYYSLLREESLFKTLVSSMAPRGSFHNIAYVKPEVWWRNTQEIIPKEVVTETSVLFGMLFPARRILLVPDDGKIRSVYLGPGLNFDKSIGMWTDPHVAYRISDKKSDKVRSAWTPLKSRAIWRNIAQLTQKDCRPIVLNNAFHTRDADEVLDVQLYGVETDQASYLNGIKHDARIPVALNGHEEAINMTLAFVQDTEWVSFCLRGSLNDSAISPATRESCIQQFFDNCERIFWKALDKLATLPVADLPEAHRQWRDTLSKQAYKARENVYRESLFRGHDLQTLAGLRAKLVAQLTKFRKEI